MKRKCVGGHSYVGSRVLWILELGPGTKIRKERRFPHHYYSYVKSQRAHYSTGEYIKVCMLHVISCLPTKLSNPTCQKSIFSLYLPWWSAPHSLLGWKCLFYTHIHKQHSFASPLSPIILLILAYSRSWLSKTNLVCISDSIRLTLTNLFNAT